MFQVVSKCIVIFEKTFIYQIKLKLCTKSSSISGGEELTPLEEKLIMSRQKKEILDSLKKNSSLAMKNVARSEVVVVLNAYDYKKEALRHLSVAHWSQ